VSVGTFVHGVQNSEDFAEPRGESPAYSPKLVEVDEFSEVRAGVGVVAPCSFGGKDRDLLKGSGVGKENPRVGAGDGGTASPVA
jgi:hypothetical protein